MVATLRPFVETYAVASCQSDAQGLADHYASDFLVSGRDGSAAFKNDERVLAWLRGVFDRNRKVGMQSLDVATLDCKPIGDHHALATVEVGPDVREDRR